MINTKIIVLVLTLVISQSIWAKNIVFLSSLPKADLKTTIKVKNIFHNKLKELADHKIIYINDADQEDIYKYLNDPETIAFFG